MTEIKTAQAWGHRSSPSALLHHAGRESAMFSVPYVIVHGLTEAEVHEAAALLEKSREECEHERFDPHAIGPTFDYVTECNKLYSSKEPYTFCACGRKVVVK